MLVHQDRKGLAAVVLSGCHHTDESQAQVATPTSANQPVGQPGQSAPQAMASTPMPGQTPMGGYQQPSNSGVVQHYDRGIPNAAGQPMANPGPSGNVAYRPAPSRPADPKSVGDLFRAEK